MYTFFKRDNMCGFYQILKGIDDLRTENEKLLL